MGKYFIILLVGFISFVGGARVLEVAFRFIGSENPPRIVVGFLFFTAFLVFVLHLGDWAFKLLKEEKE